MTDVSNQRNNRFIWRVQGIPAGLDKIALHQTIRETCALDQSHEIFIQTLSPDAYGRDKQATVRFSTTPPCLAGAAGKTQFVFDLPGESDGQQRTRILFDRHFVGQTVLYHPTSVAKPHQADILAISGLGSHAYGSFVHKTDGHMWLVDDLPRDYPKARVILWGFESQLRDSSSFAHLGNLAHNVRIVIRRHLQANTVSARPLVLIGHSLGGLLIQEALRSLAKDHAPYLEPSRVKILFFGVPQHGMDIGSLRAMVKDQPNRGLLESLSSNSPVLQELRDGFAEILQQTGIPTFCFYETEESPTAIQDPITGRYSMTGPRRCLVNSASATACLADKASRDSFAMPIFRTHSDLVKFSYLDPEYVEKVDDALRLLLIPPSEFGHPRNSPDIRLCHAKATVILTHERITSISHLILSPDGAYLLIIVEEACDTMLFTTATGCHLWTWRPDDNILRERFEFIQDGGQLVAAPTELSQASICILDAATGRVQHEINDLMAINESCVFQCCDSIRSMIAVATSNGVMVFDISTSTRLYRTLLNGKTNSTPDTNRSPSCITFSNDGTSLAVSRYDDTVELWYLSSSRPSRTPSGKLKGRYLTRDHHFSRSTIFSPEDSRLLTESEHYLGHRPSSIGCTIPSFMIWDLKTQKQLVQAPVSCTEYINILGFSDDGRQAWTFSNPMRIDVWDIVSGNLVRSHSFVVEDDLQVIFRRDIFFSDWRLLLMADPCRFDIFDLRSRRVVARLDGVTKAVTNDDHHVAFNGRYVALVQDGKEVGIWDIGGYHDQID